MKLFRGKTQCSLVAVNQFPQFDLSGQVALVTGAGRGLGRAISLALAHAGAHVALGLRDIKSHGGLPQEIIGLGRRALPMKPPERTSKRQGFVVSRLISNREM